MTSNRFHERLARQAAERIRAASTSALAEAAIAMAMPVFPCLANKAPATGAGGFKNATADADAIRAAFANPSAAMIGVPTGSISGWAVIDVDVKNGARGKEWLDANQHRLPRTRTHTTQSGGWHLIFRMPGHPLPTSISKLAPGIDVKADGGYIIVPPSPGYIVVPADTELADLPQWLIDALAPSEPIQRSPAPRHATEHGGTPYGLKALREECDAIARAPFGQQESTLNSSALKIGALVTGGELEEDVAMSELLAAARSIPSQPGRTPWRAAELERKVRRGFQDGKREPRSAPPIASATPDYMDCIQPLMDKLRENQAKKAAKPLPLPEGILQAGGVLEDLVNECTRTAIRPQPFLALGAAISAVGALAGRRYRGPSDLRTNIYVAAIGESGCGKDHAPELIKRTINDAGLDRYLGGETIASGAAVLASLEQHPARLFILDEIGMFLRTITAKGAPGHKIDIWSELMKLYSRAKGTYNGTEYANQKDRKRVNLQAPHCAVYGMTTPSTFWSALEGGAMTDGSLARWLIFVTDDNRPDRNRSPRIITPDDRIMDSLKAIAEGVPDHSFGGNIAGASHMMSSVPMEPYTVPMSPNAEALHWKHLEDDEDAWARKVEGTPQAAIVNRLGENAQKLALVRAISINPQAPVMHPDDIEWGWTLALHCARSMTKDASMQIADNEYERKLNKALKIIGAHGPISSSEMIGRGFKMAERERTEILRTLVEGNLVHALEVAPKGPGRHTVRYILSQEISDGNSSTS